MRSLSDHVASPWVAKEGTRVRSATFAEKCRRWNALAEKAGVVRSVFPSICDPFEDWQGPILESNGVQLWRRDDGSITSSDHYRDTVALTMADLRRDLFAMIDKTPNLDWLLLTKRPENVRKMWPDTKAPPQKLVNEVAEGRNGTRYALHRPNVWLLTSVSDQETADAMISHLEACDGLCPVLGVSLEPMLGPVDLSEWLYTIKVEHNGDGDTQEVLCRPRIGWVIVGGESGPKRRPMQTEWAESLVNQCRAAGVAVFMKQMEVNGKVTGDIDEFPERLRVREFPEVED